MMPLHPQRFPVLVAGGAGFLGSHLCQRLLQHGHHVVALDDLSCASLENLRPLLDHPHFDLIQRDVCEGAEVRPSCIFNLACPASPPVYQVDPVRTTLTSVLGTQRMLELACAHGVRMLQASTSEIYGEPLEHPQAESYRGNVSTTGPRACYDEGKRCAEALCFDHVRQHGASVGVARIFNTYGPGMRADDGRVVSNFITQALAGEDITVFGDGLQSRSFCYVDDMIDALLLLMASAFHGPVNLGNPQEVSMLTLAARIVRMTGSTSRIAHRPLPGDDPCRRCPDISLARKELGWEPRVPLDEGLALTIRHFRPPAPPPEPATVPVLLRRA